VARSAAAAVALTTIYFRPMPANLRIDAMLYRSPLFDGFMLRATNEIAYAPIHKTRQAMLNLRLFKIRMDHFL
jgi:hypothetical protein